MKWFYELTVKSSHQTIVDNNFAAGANHLLESGGFTILYKVKQV